MPTPMVNKLVAYPPGIVDGIQGIADKERETWSKVARDAASTYLLLHRGEYAPAPQVVYGGVLLSPQAAGLLVLDEGQRTQQLHLRLSPAEYDLVAFSARQARVRRSDWVRNAIREYSAMLLARRKT